MIKEVSRPNIGSFDTFAQMYASKNVKPLVLVENPVDTFNFSLRIKDNRYVPSGIQDRKYLIGCWGRFDGEPL